MTIQPPYPPVLRIGPVCLAALYIAAAPFTAFCAGPESPEATGPVLELPTVTVFSSRAARPEIMDAGSALDSDELRRRNRPGLSEALQDLPGLHVVNPGALGANYELSLRGGDPNFTKVLVDGIEVNNLMDSRGGSYNLNALSPLATERVELLPGSRSAIYGSEALSGILLIDTMPDPESPAPPSTVLAGEVGGGGYRRAGGSLFGFPGAQNKLSGKLSFETVAEDDVFEGTRFEVDRATAGLARRLEDGGSIRFNFFGAEIERDAFPDDSGGPEYAALREAEHRRSREAGASLRADLEPGDTLDLRFRGFYYRIEDDLDSPGVAPGARDPNGIPARTEETEFDRWGLDAHFDYRPADPLSFVVGADLTHESGSSESVLLTPPPFGPIPADFEQTVRTRGLYGEAAWEIFQGHRLSLALRHDDIEEQSNQSAERAAYAVDLPFLHGGARLAYGTGYKKPSFYALGNPIVGNPDLREEESELYEFAVSTRPAGGAVLLATTLFVQDFTDLIDFSPGPPPQLVNRDEVTARGFTGELSWQARPDLLVEGNLTYVDLDLPSGSGPIRNRPEWQAAAVLTWTPVDAVQLSAQGRYVDDRIDSSIPTGQRRLASYFLVDLAAAWKPNDRFRVTLSMDNLFDRRVERTLGYEDPGIRARFGVEASF